MATCRPRWKEPEFSKREINEAGNIVRNTNVEKDAALQARIVIDNWRASHAYPLHVFYMNLRNKAGTRSDIIVAERLKRLESIVDKLHREKHMELYRMQDLGGCRMVLPFLKEVYEYSDRLKKSEIRHELKNQKDYITNPKTSGYRSLHLIYKFKTDTPKKEIFNQYSMLIELQFRTHLQHIWATAVEAIGLFTNQALKSGKGSESIKRFFVLVSSLFAIKENTPLVPNTPKDQKDIIKEIRELDAKDHVIDMLRAVRVAIERQEDSSDDKKGYYILQLNYEKHMLRKWFFRPSQVEMANLFYDRLEAERGDEPLDTVLVRASSFSTVQSAYPNYFLDIEEFVGLVNDYLTC